jgi:hypothetical protein
MLLCTVVRNTKFCNRTCLSLLYRGRWEELCTNNSNNKYSHNWKLFSCQSQLAEVLLVGGILTLLITFNKWCLQIGQSNWAKIRIIGNFFPAKVNWYINTSHYFQ